MFTVMGRFQRGITLVSDRTAARRASPTSISVAADVSPRSPVERGTGKGSATFFVSAGRHPLDFYVAYFAGRDVIS
jgi:hypothetical protein